MDELEFKIDDYSRIRHFSNQVNDRDDMKEKSITINRCLDSVQDIIQKIDSDLSIKNNKDGDKDAHSLPDPDSNPLITFRRYFRNRSAGCYSQPIGLLKMDGGHSGQHVDGV